MYDDEDEDDPEFADINTAYNALLVYEARLRDEEDADSLVMDLVVGDVADELRPPFPDFNDANFPQDRPAGTFRGIKVTLRDLLVDDDIDWESAFNLFPQGDAES